MNVEDIRKELNEKILENFIFELNDSVTHQAVEMFVAEYLDILVSNRKIEGYVVDAVEAENTKLSIRGRVIIEGEIYSIDSDLGSL